MAAFAEASQRRICRLLGQSRSTQDYQCRIKSDEPVLVKEIINLAKEYGRYGYRMITGLLKLAGWDINHKRVERIWRREGLKVPQKQPKRRRLWRDILECCGLNRKS